MRAIALLLAAALCCGGVHAAVPHQINYQGYLTTAGGTPVNATVPMVVNVYSVAMGGAPLHTETHMVTVTSGVFSVLLGSMTPLPLTFDVPYWLGVSVGADPEMTPRQPVAAAAYAIRAASAEALAATAQVAGSQIASGQVVKSVNALRDDVTLAAGTNIAITPAGSTLTISSTSGGVGGSGTTGTIPLWSAGTTLGNSQITQSGAGVQLPNGVQLAFGAQGNQMSFGSPNGETGMTIAGPGGRSDVRFDGTTLRLVAGPPGSPPAHGIAITPSIVQLPANVSLAATPSGNNVSFGSPNAETGMVMSGASGRADVRFDGTTLRLLAGPPASGPPTKGIAISPSGDVRQEGGGRGLVKATAYVAGNGVVSYCFNGFFVPAPGTCGFTVSKPSTGVFVFTFDQPINPFVSITPICGQGCGANLGYFYGPTTTITVNMFATPFVNVLADFSFLMMMF